MAKFVFKKRGGTFRPFRRYVSSKRGDRYFTLDVNLRKNVFLLFFFDGEKNHLWLSLRNETKEALAKLGFCLDDFTNYARVVEFTEVVAESVKCDVNKIRASLSDLFCYYHDIY